MSMKEINLDELDIEEISSHNNFANKDLKPLEVKELLLELVTPDPFQPRKTFEVEKLKELSESIKEHGLLQPISVLDNGNNTYIILAGERRYKAHLLANLKTIRALVYTWVDTTSSLIKQIIENTQRDDLTVFEEARSYKILWDSKEFATKKELAKAVSKKENYLSKMFSVLNLDEELLNHLAENNPKVGLEVLSELTKIEDIKTQKEFYYDYIAGKITREDIRNKKRNISAPTDIIIHEGQTTIKDILGEDEETGEESSTVKADKPTQKKKNNILLNQDGYMLASREEDDKIYLTHIHSPSIQIIANVDFINEYSKNFKANKIYKISIEEVGEAEDFL